MTKTVLRLRIRRKALDLAKRPPLRFVARPIYESLIAAELAWERRRTGPCVAVDELTAVIKTFERPYALDRLLESIERLYPSLRVIIVDDSRRPRHIESSTVSTIVLPYDSGVSKGRNAGLAAVRTRFVLTLDDDFVLMQRSSLERAVEVLKLHADVDLVGGQLFTLPTYAEGLSPTNRKYFGGRSDLPAAIGGLEVYDRLLNFYVGRVERVREIAWDPELKRLDHTDFFRRAFGKLVSVFEPRLRAIHAMTPFDDAYLRKRFDLDADLLRLRTKWGA